jgi:hypothetical protein
LKENVGTTHHLIGVVAQECLPALGRRPAAFRHIFSDRGLTNVDAELEEFAVDPRRAPQRLARLTSWISCRISSATFGLPLRWRDFHRQNNRKPARCQRINVSGFAIAKASLTAGAI